MEKPDTYHHKPNCKEDEGVFKCASCGLKYGACMEATDSIYVCRWCSGEEN